MGKITMNRHLAEALDREMVARGLSNNELGRKAGIAPNTIANYRDKAEEFTSRGKPRSAKLAEIEKIAEALGIEAIALLGPAGQAPAVAATPATAQPGLSPMEADLLAAFRELPEAEQLELAHDTMARAERLNELVKRALDKRGIKVTTYAADRRVADAYGRAPVPSPPDTRQLELDVGPRTDNQA